MSKLRYEVLAKTGTYEKDGETKNRYLKIGVVLQGDKGFSLKLEAVPTAWDGWAILSEPKPKEDYSKARAKRDEEPDF